MSRKSGKSQTLSKEQKLHVLEVLKKHRYPEKNRAIFALSFYLGLKAQTIASLRIQDIARLSSEESKKFKLKKLLHLPKDFVKSRQDVLRVSQKYDRNYIRMSLTEFEYTIQKISDDIRNGKQVNYIDYLPPIKPSTNSIERSYCLDTPELSILLKDHLRQLGTIYVSVDGSFKRELELTDPLFITQKGGAYSPNTLQDHMGMVLKKWAGFNGASSHSGRRSLVKEMMECENESLDSIKAKIGYRSITTITNYK